MHAHGRQYKTIKSIVAKPLDTRIWSNVSKCFASRHVFESENGRITVIVWGYRVGTAVDQPTDHLFVSVFASQVESRVPVIVPVAQKRMTVREQIILIRKSNILIPLGSRPSGRQ
jgi:hypothetical protein